jgi:mono/diheme cytochrome c family protein
MRKALIVLSAAALLAAAGCHSEESGSSEVQLSPAAKRGKRTFQMQCAVCHYANRKEPLHGPSLKGLYKHPNLPSGIPVTDEHVRMTIENGRKMMPPFRNSLDTEQINDVIQYLKTL